MAIDAGQRLGPYEILAQVGAGGMGEVYRARDTRLGREVAVKVLPSHLSVSAESRQRFEREARAVSSLNHPHICTLHDVGQQDGVHYLVMELLEGETVAARLARGPMPLGEVLRVAAQVADGLDRAHRQGIVHRDLKPGNIMLTKAGAKLLDFGLARAAGGPLGGVSGLTADATLTSPLTAQGHIVGTFQYMSPEQLEGKEADHRSDIFSFAAVIYEMVSGRRAFPSANHASLIAAILKEEPASLSVSTPFAPDPLERLVRTCLAKDPDQRWQSIGDVRRELLWIAESPSRPSTPDAALAPRRSRFAWAGWIVAILMMTLVLPAWWLVRRRVPDAIPAREIRFSIEAPPGGRHSSSRVDSNYAIAPDNRRIVFQASDALGIERLYIREFSSLTPVPLAGTEGGSGPFWSPDGRAIGFFSQRKLKRMNLAGGSPQALCDTGAGNGAWSPRGVILYAGRGLMKVADTGGTPERITTLDGSREEIGHHHPVFLPDGSRFLYSARSAKPGNRGVYMGALAGTTSRFLLATPFRASWIEPGYLVQITGDALTARRFDDAGGTVAGDSIILAQEISLALVPGLAGYSATSPTAVAWRKDAPPRLTELRWFDRTGRDLGTVIPAVSDVSLELSPDGERAATGRVTATGDLSPGGEPTTHIFVIDLSRGVSSRLTLDDARSDENPVWSPDGRRIVFASHQQGGPASLFVRSATGTDAPRVIEWPLGESLVNPHPIDWSPDGRSLLTQANSVDVLGLHLVLLDLESGTATPLTSSTADEGQGQFSPDGRYVAYTSDESGVKEVYVMTMPSGAERWQISSAGGYHPRWRPDGKELYYLDPRGRLTAVALSLTPEFKASAPTPLFVALPLDPDFTFYGGQAGYDVSPDGQRFLVNHVVSEEASSPINVLLNWSPPPAAPK